MSRFYGEMCGGRKPVIRQGTKDSGITAHISGWNIGAYIRIFVNEDGEDELAISLTGGSNAPNDTTFVCRESTGKAEEFILGIGGEIRIAIPKPQSITLEVNK